MPIQYDYATLRQLGQGGIRDALQQSEDRQWQGQQRATQAQAMQAQRDKAQNDLRDQQAAKQLKLLASIADLPEDRQAAVYAAVRPTAQRLNPGYELPEAFDPAVVQFARNQAIGPEKLAELKLREQSNQMMGDYRTQMLDYRQMALDAKQPDMTTDPASGLPVPTGKAPSGYRFAPDGQSLEPIPGGPGTAISPELAARLGLAKKAIDELPALKKQVETGAATGPLDYASGSLGFGESGQVQRRIADGADALQRMLTGAGMPQSEASDYANRFRATAKDTSATLTDKLTNLDTILREQIAMATRGKGGIGSVLTPAGKPAATDPRVQQALDAGYTMDEITAYLGTPK